MLRKLLQLNPLLVEVVLAEAVEYLSQTLNKQFQTLYLTLVWKPIRRLSAS